MRAGYSQMTGGYDGGQAEYVRVPFGVPQRQPASVETRGALPTYARSRMRSACCSRTQSGSGGEVMPYIGHAHACLRMAWLSERRQARSAHLGDPCAADMNLLKLPSSPIDLPDEKAVFLSDILPTAWSARGCAWACLVLG